MSSDTPTNPSFPAADGIVARVGAEPIPALLDLDHNGIRDYQEKKYQKAAADFFYWLIGLVFPRAPQTQVVKISRPIIEQIIERVGK